MQDEDKPLVILFGYSSDVDKLVFLGRKDEVVLTLSEELRNTAIQILSFCNGARTLKEIESEVSNVSKVVFRAIIDVCESQNIICDSRKIFSIFHQDSANPLLYANNLSKQQVINLVENRTKNYPKSRPIKIELPNSEFLKLLSNRKSASSFEDVPLSPEMLGGILSSMYVFGDTRPVPSAGKLYSLEIYVFVKSEQQAIKRGLYRYDPDCLQLYPLNKQVADSQLHRILDSYQAVDCSFILFVAADFERITAKYSNRGYRYALIEAGHVAQNAYLFCTENNLAIREFGGFQDKPTADFLDLKYPQKAVLTVLLIGGKSVEKPIINLSESADALREILVGPNLPLEWAQPCMIEFEGDSFPKFSSIAKFREQGEDSRLITNPDNIAFGVSISSHEASIKAMVEGFERYASSVVRTDVNAKASALDAEFFDPLTATPYSHEQIRLLQLDEFDKEKEIGWVSGKRWLSGKKIYIPVEHVYYPIGLRLDRKPCYRATSSGVAAHFNPEEAQRRALYELIERDAILLTWYSRRQVPEVSSDIVGIEGELRRKYWDKKGWKVLFLDLTIDSIPVVLVVIYSRDKYPAFVSGASANPSARLAALKALDEAETMLILATQEKGENNIDAANVHSPMDHGRLFFKTENLVQIEWLLNPSNSTKTTAKIEIGDLLNKFNPITVDITPVSPQCGIKVYRALSENLLPIHFGTSTGHTRHSRFEVVGFNWRQEIFSFPHFFA